MAKRHSKPSTKTNSNTKSEKRPPTEPEEDSEDQFLLRARTEDIELSKLKIDKQHFKRAVDEAQANSIAESMKELGGVINPLTVRPILEEPGMFGIISGRERYGGALANGMEKVSCKIAEGCSDKQARKISIHENLKRSTLTPDERERGLAELVEIHEAEQLQQRKELGPTAAPSKKRGRPINAAVRKAAAEAKVSTRTVQIAVKATKERTRKTTATSAVGEPDITDTVQPTSLSDEEHLEEDVGPRLAKLARKLDRIRAYDIDPLLASMVATKTPVLANVEPKDAALLVQFVQSWRKLVAVIAPELGDKLKPAPAPASPAAETSTPKSSDAVTVPAAVADQLRLGPLPPEPLNTATSDTTAT